MVRSAFFQIFVFHLRLRQQQLVLRRQRQIMRHMQVFQHLLRDALEHWRRNLATLMQSHGGIKNHRNYDLRIVHRSEACERPNIFCLGIRPRRRINFLRRSRLSRRRVAFENRFAPRALQHNFLHHRAHLGGRVGRNHAM